MKTGARESESRYRALLQLLRTADTLWNASRLFFERWRISPSQFNILNLLYSEPSGLSQTELSRQLIMHRSNVTGLVDRLEARGLVRRKDVASDRRAYRVVLTETGRRLLKRILPRYYEGAERVWNGLSPRRITELTAALRDIALKAEAIAAEPHLENTE